MVSANPTRSLLTTLCNPPEITTSNTTTVNNADNVHASRPGMSGAKMSVSDFT